MNPSPSTLGTIDLTSPLDALSDELRDQVPDMRSSFRIGDVTIEGRVALAPMAGVSVKAFRRQGRRFGASMVCSEMVSSCGLHYSNERTQRFLRIAADEHPIAVQLFGSDPALLAEAATMVEQAGADLIDINMGCPVRKVAKTGAGASLIDDPNRAVAVARAVVEATRLPVMVKLRRGIRQDSRDCLTLGPRLAVEAGVSALTLHPRSASQMYRGFADHSLTAELAALVDVPVLASGDVTDRHTAEHVMALTGAAAVMIGRAAQGNPWTLHEIVTGERPQPGAAERVAELVAFIADVVEEMGAARATGFLRKFYGWYLRGPEFGRELRRELTTAGDPHGVARMLLARFPEAESIVRSTAARREAHAPASSDRVLELPLSQYGGG